MQGTNGTKYRWIIMTSVTAAITILLLTWWINVKDRLFADDGHTAEPSSSALHGAGPTATTTAASPTSNLEHGSEWRVGQTWTNSHGIRLVYAPPGEFVSPRDAEMAPILHRAPVPKRLTKGFLIGMTEVTQAQWRVVMGTTPWSGQESVMNGNDYPANFVSWENCVEFCKKLREMEGKKYRLPTQIEWEYACRAGTTTTYPFGSFDDRSKLGDYGWSEENTSKSGERYAHRVSLKKPNPWGLYDTLGNVSEWCSDLEKPNGKLHVFCGGSWIDDSGGCTPDTVLHDFASDNGRSDVEFRICADLDGITPSADENHPIHAEGADAKAEVVAGLGRAGHSPDSCLICAVHRTATAKLAYSDRRGYGLCDKCGSKYGAWVVVLSKGQRGLAPDENDGQVTDDFKAVMSEHFHRADSDGRRGMGLFFLTGKFGSEEWNILTGSK
jgi:formylglycine-generating enzyme required for sulfatase activity